MGWLYQNAIKPALFRLDAEQAHELSVHALALLGQVRPLCAAFERIPVATRLFQQAEGANDIGLDEFSRAVDGAIDMAFGSEIDNRSRLMLFQ